MKNLGFIKHPANIISTYKLHFYPDRIDLVLLNTELAYQAV